MAGAGQFGNAEQGIFSYWIRSWKDRRPLKYLGFGGMGHQVRDCLNPRDLCSVLFSQFDCTSVETRPQTINLSGGVESAMSLAQLSEFCCGHIHYYNPIGDGAERAFDIPWIVLDNSLAGNVWKWSPKISIQETLLEIRDACQNP